MCKNDFCLFAPVTNLDPTSKLLMSEDQKHNDGLVTLKQNKKTIGAYIRK